MSSIAEYRVIDLPDPVYPVTRGKTGIWLLLVIYLLLGFWITQFTRSADARLNDGFENFRNRGNALKNLCPSIVNHFGHALGDGLFLNLERFGAAGD